MFAYICAGAAKRGRRILLLCHRVELVDQISNALADQGVPHGFIAHGYPYRGGFGVYIASVFTVARRLQLFKPDLIIVDECHHTVASTWDSILKAYPAARRLGVTATPCRTNGAGLGSHYDDLILGPSTQELTDAGFLTPLSVYAPPTVDSTGLHVRGGEFIQSEVVSRSDKPKVTGDCIEHYRKHCAGKRAILFDVSIDAARRRAEAFRQAGFVSHHIDGTTAREVRAMAIADFRAGRIQVLTSCELVSEGFDLPAIEVGISLRPTQSLALWLQQTGRLLRPMAGKSAALLFDHTGNWERHGFPTETRSWSLSGVAKGAHGAKPQSGVRVCTACFAVSAGSARSCRACGKDFPVQARMVKEAKGQLEALTPEEIARKREARHRAQTQGRAQSLPALIELYNIRHPGGDPQKAERWAGYVLAGRRARGIP